MLQAYIHDRDNTAVNIESPTIEIASPQRGEKRSYQVANSASPQTGEKRPYQVSYVASPQPGPKRTYEDADLASPVGLQTTTSSMGANLLELAKSCMMQCSHILQRWARVSRCTTMYEVS